MEHFKAKNSLQGAIDPANQIILKTISAEMSETICSYIKLWFKQVIFIALEKESKKDNVSWWKALISQSAPGRPAIFHWSHDQDI